MSFSIYGGYLRPGYCEVHPDTKGYYPCPDCDAEHWAELDYRNAQSEQLAEYDEQCRQEYERYQRDEWYRARASEWLRCHRTGEDIPHWWHQ